MKKGLKRTLFIGMATLSAIAAGALSQSKDASAKSYPTVQYNRTLATDGTERNVISTGTNALFNKAGTLRGARKIATTTTMRHLGNSSSSKNYFRVYRVARTSRGSIYYKIVSFDQKYRGWIYGGRSAIDFAGGIQSTQTTRNVSLSTEESTKTYQFAAPGTTNVIWKYPSWTQYKAGKIISSTAPYATDDLTIDRAVVKTREGSKFYYVKSAQHPSINGWIYDKAVKLKETPTYDVNKQVQVTFKNPANNTTVATTQWTNPLTTSKQNDDVTAAFNSEVKNANSALMSAIPSGYTYDVTNQANVNTLQKVLVGQSIVLNVKPTTGVNEFVLTDAVAYSSPGVAETSPGIADVVRNAYRGEVIKNLVLPYKYDASVANNLPTILRDLGHGTVFMNGTQPYTVDVSFSNSNVANVKLIKGQAVAKTVNTDVTLNNSLNPNQQAIADKAIRAAYDVRTGAVKPWSTMTQDELKNNLLDGKTDLTATAVEGDKTYTFTYKADVAPAVNNSVLTGVTVNLTLTNAVEK